MSSKGERELREGEDETCSRLESEAIGGAVSFVIASNSRYEKIENR